MNDTEIRIIEGAIEAVLKYGPKKTTMADIAAAAGLTRQTVYATFGNKDNVLAAMVGWVGDQHLEQVAAEWVSLSELGDKLDSYFRIVVVEVFTRMAASDDPQEVLSGLSSAAKVAYAKVGDDHAAMWAQELAREDAKLAASGLSPETLGRFIVTTCFNLKKSEISVAGLNAQLSTLRAAVLSLTTNL